MAVNGSCQLTLLIGEHTVLPPEWEAAGGKRWSEEAE